MDGPTPSLRATEVPLKSQVIYQSRSAVGA